jgi:hypothetical protein
MTGSLLTGGDRAVSVATAGRKEGRAKPDLGEAARATGA